MSSLFDYKSEIPVWFVDLDPAPNRDLLSIVSLGSQQDVLSTVKLHMLWASDDLPLVAILTNAVLTLLTHTHYLYNLSLRHALYISNREKLSTPQRKIFT